MPNFRHYLDPDMSNKQARTVLLHMLNTLRRKKRPEHTLEEKLSALAMGLEALEFWAQHSAQNDDSPLESFYTEADIREVAERLGPLGGRS